jgi:hypothetical protein
MFTRKLHLSLPKPMTLSLHDPVPGIIGTTRGIVGLTTRESPPHQYRAEPRPSQKYDGLAEESGMNFFGHQVSS